MEELRSTEILDREIQDDARRKADKAIKAGELEANRILEEVGPRLQKAEEEKTAEFYARLRAFQRDVDASRPLERERTRISFVDSSVQKSVDAWFDSRPAGKRLSLYVDRLAKARSVFASAPLEVRAAGFSASEVTAAVTAVLGGSKGFSVKIVDSAAAVQLGFTEGLLATAQDGSVTCRATREELRSEVLLERRQELAEALLGGRLPE